MKRFAEESSNLLVFVPLELNKPQFCLLGVSNNCFIEITFILVYIIVPAIYGLTEVKLTLNL